MQFQSFQAPKRTLLGPGPSDVSPRILAAMARPTIGHLDPEFVRMMDEVKAMLKYAFQTKNEMTMAVSGPGMAGMEMCVVNLVEPGDKVIVCRNGVFGGRMISNVERCGGTAIVVDDEWGKPIDLNKVAEAFQAHPDAKVLGYVHAETSTGVRSDAAALTKLAHDHGALAIADTVTSLGGIPVLIDEWGVDAVYSGSQKCLSCTPGLSPVSFGPRAIEKIKNRKTQVQSWFLDLNLVMNYWGSGAKRSYHHTAPINALYGLHESLVMLCEEGLEARWKRHHDHHLLLKAALEPLGLSFFVEEEYRLPQLNAMVIPEGVNDGQVRSYLLKEYSLEIGGGLGPGAGKLWRIGLMGHSARQENIDLVQRALADALVRFKVTVA